MNIDTPWLLALLAVVALGLAPLGATAQTAPPAKGDNAPTHNFGLRIEPGLAVPLTKPQTDRFNLGGGQTVKGFYNVMPWLDVGPTISFSDLPASDGFTRSGTSWDFGAGLRLKGSGSGSLGMFPWFDADALYVRTGELDRFGYDAGAGLSLGIGPKKSFRLGPFVRFRQILQPERSSFDNRDARLLHAGISLEFGAPRGGAPAQASTTRQNVAKSSAAECPEPRECPEPKRAEEKPDRDGDGVPDEFDPCPDVAGSRENYGCLAGDQIVVTPNKIDLKERIYFDWDSDAIKEESHSILNKVAEVLKRNTGFKVRVEGHADATGLDGYNQELSKRRAKAVIDHLVDQGVNRERFVLRGYSSSRPADTNLTDAGRKKNRRVEFVIDLEILDFDRSNRSEK